MKHVLLNSKLSPRAAVAALLGLALAALLLGGDGAVHAQDRLPPIADVRDLSIEIDRRGTSDISLAVTVYNNSTITMRNVQVRVTTDPRHALTAGGDFDPSTNIWTIPDLEPKSEPAKLVFDIVGRPTLQYVTFRAEIVGSVPAEGAANLDNNQAVYWMYVGAGYLTRILRPNMQPYLDVDNGSPGPGESPAFTVGVAELRLNSGRGVWLDQANAVVRVALSEGLAFASNPRPTVGGFSRSSSTDGLWRLGSGGWKPGTLRVPVRLSTGLGAAPPLNRRCLTAQVVDSIPPPTSGASRFGKAYTLCLGAEERIIVSGSDEVNTRLARKVDICPVFPQFCPEHDALLLSQVGGLGGPQYPAEDLLILVDAEPLANPLTIGGTTYHWATGHSIRSITNDDRFQGVRFVRRVDPNTVVKDRGFRISDVTPKERPGEIAELYRWIEGSTVKFWEGLNPGKTDKLYDKIWDTRTERDWLRLVVFSSPGVYKVDVGIEHTLKSDGKKYSATSTMTFVVGPVGDLQVHDAGLHGGLPRGQQAYTLRAENNMDGTVEQVEVALAGVPQGARAVVSGDGGRYSQGACDENGLCDGLWKIGGLESRDYRYNTGRSDGPTLTLLVEGNPEPITATIASAKTRTVTAGGKTYDIGVTDLVESNSKDVRVAAAAGRGERDPEQPMSLRVARLGSTALLRWEPVETVSRWPVAYYQVERDNRVLDVQVKAPLYLDLRESGGSSVYRVRAVNEFGAPGPWTERTSRGEAEKAQPPDPVTGLTAVPGDGFVDLEWRAIRSDEEIIWQLWRLDDPTWREVFPRAVGSSRLGYTVTELGNGVEYVFRVRAVTPSDDFGDLVGVASDLVSATPAAAQGQQSPEQGRTDEDKKQDDGPNHAPEFDRDAAWYPATPWCARAGAHAGTEVARVTAYDADGDSLAYYHIRGFDAIADEYFTVSTVKNGDAYEGVVRVSRTIPKDLEPHEGFINIDLEVNDGRGGLDQIGVSLKYAADGGTCQ